MPKASVLSRRNAFLVWQSPSEASGASRSAPLCKASPVQYDACVRDSRNGDGGQSIPSKLIAHGAIAVAAVSLISCGDAPSYPRAQLELYSGVIPVDTLVHRSEWAMSSDEGLWEDSIGRRVLVERADRFCLSDSMRAIGFVPGVLDTHDHWIVVSDHFTHQVLLADTSGSIHWIVGETGEGPGRYCSGPRCSVGPGGICAWDMRLQKIDLYDFNGNLQKTINEYTNLALWLDDRVVLVAVMTDDGLVRVLDPATGDRVGTGCDEHLWSWENVPCYKYGVHATDIGKVASVSFSHTHLVIADLSSMDVELSPGRALPFQLPENGEVGEEGGNVGFIKYYLYAGMFIGPHDMINLVVCCPNTDGAFPKAVSYSDRVFTLVDRYDWDGSYLDSYFIPMSGIACVDYLDGYLYAINYNDEAVYRFRVLTNGG